MPEEPQVTDSAIRRVEYKINKANATTPRQEVEKKVESQNISIIKSKEERT